MDEIIEKIDCLISQIERIPVKYDEWINKDKDSNRIAPLYTMTKDEQYNHKKRDNSNQQQSYRYDIDIGLEDSTVNVPKQIIIANYKDDEDQVNNDDDDKSSNNESNKIKTTNNIKDDEIFEFEVSNNNKLKSNIIVFGYIRKLKNLMMDNIPTSIINICSSLYCFQVNQIKINNKIDHRDNWGKFCVATIVDINDNNIKIHYNGVDDKYDVWCDYKKETHRFTQYQSISKRKSKRTFTTLSIGDYIEINPIYNSNDDGIDGWKKAKIKQFDKNSGQLQVQYSNNNESYLYWVHLDNDREVRESVNEIENDEDNYRSKYTFGGCDSCGSDNNLKTVSAGTFCWSCRYLHWSCNYESIKEERTREKRWDKAVLEGWADDM